MSGLLNSRWGLRVQAMIFRFLMQFAMWLGRLPSPRPIPHAFERKIPSSVSINRGEILVKFYLPKEYRARKRLDGKRFPIVVNFHGGGFTIGAAGDDSRWNDAVVDQVGAVVADVNYRLAPEHSFPTAVEDGVDVVSWITEHANDLHVDVTKIVVSGFSAGGNLAVTVPMMLQDRLEPVQQDVPYTDEPSQGSPKTLGKGRRGQEAQTPKIATIVAFYPALDYTQDRDQRLASFAHKEHAIPRPLYNLFDKSYLYPPTLDKSSPYLSPGVAPDAKLQALPDELILFTCEWDMLKAEGERFRSRLEGLGKKVAYKCIPSVPHGWDKHPHPFKVAPSITETYRAACKELTRILGPSSN